MVPQIDLKQLFSDPFARSYLISILDATELTADDKFNKIEQLVDKISLMTTKILREETVSLEIDDNSKVGTSEDSDQRDWKNDRVACKLGRELSIWDPDKLLDELKTTLQRAIGRMVRCQSPDGGWGSKFQESNAWYTAYAIRVFYRALKIDDLASAVDRQTMESLINSGGKWLLNNVKTWYLRDIEPRGERKVYEPALIVIALRQVESYLYLGDCRDSLAAEVEISLQQLLASQNTDGGWDANVWGSDIKDKGIYSEVGATALAVEALASGDAPPSQEIRQALEKAVNWFVKTQNEEGSWNLGSCHDTTSCKVELVKEPKVVPALNKTADAVRAISAARRWGVDNEACRTSLGKAVIWIYNQEKPLFQGSEVIGWAWQPDRYGFYDTENTCLALEALCYVEDAPISLLSANAQWLMKIQFVDPGNIEEGGWRPGHTGRITYALLTFYERLLNATKHKDA